MPLIDFLKKLNILDPKKVTITFEEKENSLKLVVDGKLLGGLIPAKPFPITYPEFIIFKDSSDVDVCIIKNYKDLDPESQKNLESLLEKMYFIPTVSRIDKIETSGDEFQWEILTNKGARSFRTRGRMSVIQMSNRIIVTDIHDNVYEIEDLYKLDSKSRREIEATL